MEETMPRGKKGSGPTKAKQHQSPAAAPETPAAGKENTMTTTTGVNDAQAQSPAAAPETPAAAAPKSKRVIFLASDKPGGSAPITIGVNDEHGTHHFHTFQREEEVEVPVHVLAVVDTAVETVYERKGDRMVDKQVKRFPYQVVTG